MYIIIIILYDYRVETRDDGDMEIIYVTPSNNSGTTKISVTVVRR